MTCRLIVLLLCMGCFRSSDPVDAGPVWSDIGPSQCEGDKTFLVWEWDGSDGVTECLDTNQLHEHNEPRRGRPLSYLEIGVGSFPSMDAGRACSFGVKLLNLDLETGLVVTISQDETLDEVAQVATAGALFVSTASCERPVLPDRFVGRETVSGELRVIRGGGIGDIIEFELRDIRFELSDGDVYEIPYAFARDTLEEPI